MLSLNHNTASLKPSKMLLPVSFGSTFTFLYSQSLIVIGGDILIIFEHFFFFFLVETDKNKECMEPCHPVPSHTTHTDSRAVNSLADDRSFVTSSESAA